MATAMNPLTATGAGAPRRGTLWAGRILSGLVVAFLLFDGITKVLRVPAVLKAAAQLGFTAPQMVGIGMLLLVCTAIYAIPRTTVLGAVLLTGYLGGATCIQVHAGNPLFETLFPVFFGALAWWGVYLREPGLLRRIALRRE